MDDEIVWFEFNSEEAKGKIGVMRGVSGLEIVLDNGTKDGQRLALVDLYYQSDDAKEIIEDAGIEPFVQIIMEDMKNPDENVCGAMFLKEGTQVWLEVGANEKHHDPIHGGECYGYPKGYFERKIEDA